MHAGTLSQPTQTALALLGSTDVLKSAYLIGGTALALQLGYRRSEDLDFCVSGNILAKDIASQLAKIGTFNIELLAEPHTLLGEFNQVKLSVFRYDYPLLDPYSNYLGIKVAGVRDIAAMKLTAICGRAKKRDYVDIYFLAKNFLLPTLFKWYEEKYHQLGNNKYVIIRSLGFFDDAEEDQMPKMLIPLTWEEVKNYLLDQSNQLAKKYLEEY